MSDIINLRQARKRAVRAAREAEAAANRTRHGRSKAERAVADAERDALRRTLDRARRDEPDSGAR